VGQLEERGQQDERHDAARAKISEAAGTPGGFKIKCKRRAAQGQGDFGVGGEEKGRVRGIFTTARSSSGECGILRMSEMSYQLLAISY
jgi:hypothetical protein